jgi:hypothetical protein
MNLFILESSPLSLDPADLLTDNIRITVSESYAYPSDEGELIDI